MHYYLSGSLIYGHAHPSFKETRCLGGAIKYEKNIFGTICIPYRAYVDRIVHLFAPLPRLSHQCKIEGESNK